MIAQRETTSQKLLLVGEIVETLEQDGRRFITVVLRSCCIDLDPDPVVDLHLGDTIVVEAGITVHAMASGAHDCVSIPHIEGFDGLPGERR